jgi:hypothetical protein
MVGSVVLGNSIQAAPLIRESVRRGIPTLIAKIDSPTERGRAVDDADLFVVRGAEWMPVVENEVNPGVNAVPDPALPPLALQDVEVRMIPDEKVKLKGGLLLTEPHDFIPEALDHPLAMATASGTGQRQARVDLPAGENRVIPS